MLCEVSWKTLKSSSSLEASKTLDSVLPVGKLSSLISSWCGKLTRGGDLAARRCLSWQGITAKGLLAANAARLSKNVLKLRPSKVVWLVVNPIAKPPHLKDVNYKNIIISSIKI